MRSSTPPLRPWRPGDVSPQRLVLVGGGHSHVQVLASLAMEPIPGTDVTLVLDRPVAVYSGMVPGLIAGQYETRELEIDVVPLARRAGARLVLSPATGLDPVARRLQLTDRPPLSYDWISFDVGSTVAHLDLPGVQDHALATRPIGNLTRRFEEEVERFAERQERHVAVVGGGAGGVELAFTCSARLEKRLGRRVDVTLISAGERLLEGYPERLAVTVERHARERGIELKSSARVTALEAGNVHLRDGSQVSAGLVLWATGAAPHELSARCHLPLDDAGFLAISRTLQSTGDPRVFGVGDCATLIADPRPKAGVYAVRQGPVLTHNLRSAIAGRPLDEWYPQTDFLTLLNLGDGTAIGAKWGQVVSGKWVMRLKDSIDRKFMRRFQVLDEHGAPLPDFAEVMDPEMEELMACGGCAAKVGQESLDRALARLPPVPESGSSNVLLGVDGADDVAIRRIGSQSIATSVDAFRGFADDPYLLGAVGANNALSDLHAKAARPKTTLALVNIAHDLSPDDAEEQLFQVLAGARSVLDAHDVELTGGHTTTGLELFVGFAVEGELDDPPLLLNSGVRPGDGIILTKPLGTGVLLHADMSGRCPGRWLTATYRSMLSSNAPAGVLARDHGAGSATDVTGFGLAGHLGELARSSNVKIEVRVSDLPALPGAVELLRLGERSTAHARNREAARRYEVAGDATGHDHFELLFDPQTVGGLLIAIDAARTAALIAELARHGVDARIIAEASEGPAALEIAR